MPFDRAQRDCRGRMPFLAAPMARAPRRQGAPLMCAAAWTGMAAPLKAMLTAASGTLSQESADAAKADASNQAVAPGD